MAFKVRIQNSDLIKSLKPLQQNWHSDRIESTVPSLIIMPPGYQREIFPSLPTCGWLQPFYLLHSTETALIKIHTDILASMDAGKVTSLTFLYLPTAFNTIDHTILLRRLDYYFRVTGKAFNWFISYLAGRCQRIQLCDCLSSKTDLKFGVTQGSVLGPLCYGAVSSSLLLNTDAAVMPLRLASPGILTL